MNIKLENSKQNIDKIIVGASFTFFLMLTLHKLTNASLWLDEAVEYWYSKVMFGYVPFDDELANMYQRIVITYQPPLYNVIMHFWLKISDTEWWFRFFGVVIGFIGMLGIFKSIKKISNSNIVAAGAVLFSSCIYQFAFYWQECAEYCLMLGSLCWTLYYWICLMKEANKLNVILFTLMSVVSVYSQYGAVFLIIPLCVAAFINILLSKNKKILIMTFISYCSALLFAAAPLYIFFLKKQMIAQQGGSIELHQIHFEKGILYDFYANLLNVFKWNMAFHYTETSADIWLKIVLIMFLVVLILGGGLYRCMVCINIFTWAGFYLAVKWNIYARGGFGNRYGLFFLPLWVISGFAIGCELFHIMLSFEVFEKLGIKYFYTGIVICFILCFCVLGWEKIQMNWEKEDNRGIVDEWYRLKLIDKPTLIYRGADAGFAYYIRQHDAYTEQTEDKVTYMYRFGNWTGDKYTEYINSIYGENWPDEIYIVATHYKDKDIDILTEQFISEGYSREDIYSSTKALLIRLVYSRD